VSYSISHLSLCLHGLSLVRSGRYLVPPNMSCDVALPATSRIVAPAHATQQWLADALREAVASGLPRVVALGAESALLPAWSPSLITQRVDTLSRVYSGPDERFGPFHDEQRPFSRARICTSPSHNYSEVSMRTGDFFTVHQAEQSRYVYYSGEVERDLPASMLEELRPLEAALIERNPSHASVNLWMGSSPVVSPCHYDAYHNAIAQLSGRKRFVLFPPTASQLLRPFPFLHPSHAQCQSRIDLLDPDEVAASGAVSVDLERGDILYLPPLFYHETLALDNGSIGVNG
jgi:hypothetical protein